MARGEFVFGIVLLEKPFCERYSEAGIVDTNTVEDVAFEANGRLLLAYAAPRNESHRGLIDMDPTQNHETLDDGSDASLGGRRIVSDFAGCSGNSLSGIHVITVRAGKNRFEGNPF